MQTSVSQLQNADVRMMASGTISDMDQKHSGAEQVGDQCVDMGKGNGQDVNQLTLS